MIFVSLCNSLWLCSSRDFSQFNSMQAFYSESTPPPGRLAIQWVFSRGNFIIQHFFRGGGYTIYHPLCAFVPRLSLSSILSWLVIFIIKHFFLYTNVYVSNCFSFKLINSLILDLSLLKCFKYKSQSLLSLTVKFRNNE